MLVFTVNQLGNMNKAALRNAARDHNLQHDGMNVDGLRALLAPFAVAAEDAEVVQEGAPVSIVPTTQAEVAASIPEVLAPPAIATVVPREPRVLPTLVPTTPVAVAPRASSRPEQNGVKRPSEGTKCAQIWAWCDGVAAGGGTPSAKTLRAELQLDPTTCTVQFYRWRKFNGIRGRV